MTFWEKIASDAIVKNYFWNNLSDQDIINTLIVNKYTYKTSYSIYPCKKLFSIHDIHKLHKKIHILKIPNITNLILEVKPYTNICFKFIPNTLCVEHLKKKNYTFQCIILPYTLSTLYLTYNQTYHSLLDIKDFTIQFPPTLKHLFLYNHPISFELPKNLYSLTYGTYYNFGFEKNYISSNLKILRFENSFNIKIPPFLLPALEELDLGNQFNQKLEENSEECTIF